MATRRSAATSVPCPRCAWTCDIVTCDGLTFLQCLSCGHEAQMPRIYPDQSAHPMLPSRVNRRHRECLNCGEPFRTVNERYCRDCKSVAARGIDGGLARGRTTGLSSLRMFSGGD